MLILSHCYGIAGRLGYLLPSVVVTFPHLSSQNCLAYSSVALQMLVKGVQSLAGNAGAFV